MFYSYFILTIYQSFAFKSVVIILVGWIYFHFMHCIFIQVGLILAVFSYLGPHWDNSIQFSSTHTGNLLLPNLWLFFREVPLHDTFATVFAYSLAHLLQVYCFQANGPV